MGTSELTSELPATALPDAGEGPEVGIVVDMVRRAVPFVPLVLFVCTVVRGWGGLASGALGITIVIANLVLSAALLSYAGRISLAMLGAAAMFGFLIRMGLITVTVLAVRNQSWVDPWTLGMVLIVTHLGLLFWELRYVSLSLAYPGLKPAKRIESGSAGSSLSQAGRV